MNQAKVNILNSLTIKQFIKIFMNHLWPSIRFPWTTFLPALFLLTYSKSLFRIANEQTVKPRAFYKAQGLRCLSW